MSNTKVNTAGMSAVVAAMAISAAVEGQLPELLGKDVIKQDQDINIRNPLMKLDTAIHANAVQCLLHAQKHGDTSLMRRLLVDIVDDKSGYRRQGLIAWMRRFSPMELSGDVIKLSGMVNGVPIPWDILTASRTTFRDIPEFAEQIVLKPTYKGGYVGQLERAIKAYQASVENTMVVDGEAKPIDPKKPFYSGLYLDKMDAIFDKIKSAVGEFETFSDDTAEVAAARKQHLESGRTLAEKEAALKAAKEANIQAPQGA